MALQAPTSSIQTVRPSASSSSSSSAAAALLAPIRLNAPSGLGLRSSFIPSFTLVVSSTQKQPQTLTSASRISMRTAVSKQAYICRDCGYIYNDKTPFDKLPDSFFCPVCGAPKRRFKPYSPPVDKNANAAEVRKARKAELKRDEAVGKALPIAIGVGVAALAGLYFYLNSSF